MKKLLILMLTGSVFFTGCSNHKTDVPKKVDEEKLTQERKQYVEALERNQEKYKEEQKNFQKELEVKARIEKLKEQEKIQHKRNREKLDYMVVEEFNKPSKEQLENGYIETNTFFLIDRYEFKHHNGNIPDIVFHNQCDKVCSKYSHNLKGILDGNPTLVNKEPFIKTIDTQTQYGKYNFDVSCTCIGNKYRTKEYHEQDLISKDSK